VVAGKCGIAARAQAGANNAGFDPGRGLYMPSQTSIPPCLRQA